jgi:hypothetical protein
MGIWDAVVGGGSSDVCWECLDGTLPGRVLRDGCGGQYITAFPASHLVVVHKVNIHQDPHRNVSEPAYMTILDIVLDAKCDKNCKQGSLVLR